MRKRLFAIALLVFSTCLVAQQSLNNDSVVKLVKAGLSDDLIISTINASPGTYDTSPDGLIALKTAGVGDKVVSAIVIRASASALSPAVAGGLRSDQPIPVQVNPASVVAPGTTLPSTAAQTSPPLPFHSTDGKVRIYITDHPIFESTGIGKAAANRHGGAAAGVSHTQSGDDPRTVEVQADIMKVCPAFIVASNNPDRADLVLVFRRRGGERSSFFAFGGLTGLALAAGAKVDGASLFQSDGDMIYATKQNSVEKAIKDVCAHVPAPILK